MALAPMNSSANHGIITRVWLADPCAGIAADNTSRNGASIITRSIFSITAMPAASSLTLLPATMTCATSWMVEPAKMPNACCDSPRCEYSGG